MYIRIWCLSFLSLNQTHSLFFLQLLHSVLGENHRAKAGSDVFVHFVSGGLSGMTAASTLYPLDLVRTRLAAQVIATFC